MGDGKLSKYSAWVEFYGGLPEVVQEDPQRRLDIDWTAPDALQVDNIIQEVIDLEDSKLERQRFLRSTHSAPVPTASTPEQKTHEASREMRSAQAPKKNSQRNDYLTELMDRTNVSMVEIAKRNAQMDNLIAIVGELNLNLSQQEDS